MKRLSIFFVACVVICNGCKKGIVLPECETTFHSKYPMTVIPNINEIQAGDSLKLRIHFSFKQFNYVTSDTVNIKQFNKILLGILLSKYSITDSSIESVGAKNDFRYFSPNVAFDFKDGTSSGTNARIRFVLKKDFQGFSGDIFIIPMKKGLYYLKVMDGLIEDACALNSLRPYFSNYSVESAMRIWERIARRPLIDEELKRPISDWQSEYFFFVN